MYPQWLAIQHTTALSFLHLHPFFETNVEALLSCNLIFSFFCDCFLLLSVCVMKRQMMGLVLSHIIANKSIDAGGTRLTEAASNRFCFKEQNKDGAKVSPYAMCMCHFP